MENKTAAGLVALALILGIAGTTGYNAITGEHISQNDFNITNTESLLKIQATSHDLIEKDFDSKINSLLQENLKNYAETINTNFPSLQDKRTNIEIQNQTAIFNIEATADYSTGEKPYYQVKILMNGEINFEDTKNPELTIDYKIE